MTRFGPDDRRRPVEPLDQRRRFAAARQAGVKPGDVGQRDAEAAEADRQADRRVLGQRDLGARAVQPGEKTRRPDIGEQFDRRQVERHLQRLARRHRALVAEVEIFRRIGAVTRGPVEQHGLGMRETFLESERIDEGLQRRTRRARRARHVDGPVARGVEIIGGADPRPDLAAGIVDDDDRRGKLGAEARDRLARQRFELGLQARVDRELQHMGARVGRDGLFRGVRGEQREGLAGLGNRLPLGRVRLLRRDDSARGDAIEHARARDAGRFGKALRPARLRRLRQRDEQRRLADGQSAAALCRNRRARPRARLRDCRRRAPA